MTKKEFEKHLKNAYVLSRKHELISEKSAEIEFEKLDLGHYSHVYLKTVESIALKCFMYKCSGDSVDVIRNFLVHDFVLGDLFWDQE